MRILAINNYDLDWPLREWGKVPKHQFWGVDYIRQCGDVVDTYNWTIPRVFFWFFRKYATKVYSFVWYMYLFLYGKKYDTIVSFFSYDPCLKTLVSLKQKGVISARIITVVHHSGVSQHLLSKFDKCIFLSKEILEKSYKSLNKEKTCCLWWGADLSFYEIAYSQMKRTKEERYRNMIVVSTGKTTRDNKLLSNACDSLKIRCLLFDKSINETIYTKTTSRAGYLDMVSRMTKCSINAVPVINFNKGEIQSIRGFNSIIDGLALGMPLLVSDNCNLPFNVEELHMGLYYRNGNLDSLIDKLSYMSTNSALLEEMSRNARNFATKNDYLKYCKELYEVLKSSNR